MPTTVSPEAIQEPVSVDDNAASLTVDVGTALPAGTNAIGKLAANSGVDIGDVDVLSIAAGDNNIGNVDLASPLGAGTEAAAVRVTVATDSTGLLSVDDNGGSLTVDNAQLSVVGGGTEAAAMRVTVANDSTGVLSVDDNAGSLTVDFNSISTGGCKFFKSIDLDETEEEVSATAATLYGFWVTNTATATRFVKIYNATAANVTVGTTVPDITIGIPGNSSDDVAGNLTVPFPGGVAFGTALTFAATTGVADADAGAPGANDVVITVFFRN